MITTGTLMVSLHSPKTVNLPAFSTFIVRVDGTEDLSDFGAIGELAEEIERNPLLRGTHVSVTHIDHEISAIQKVENDNA